jgi:predicted RNase H-like HicB family nuclease
MMDGFWLRCEAAIASSSIPEAGRATVAGWPSDDTRDPEQNLEAGGDQGEEMMRYAVVIEKAGDNFSGYVPDLPGCIATGDTVAAVEQELRDAIRFHIDGLEADRLPVPPPSAVAEYVEG